MVLADYAGEYAAEVEEFFFHETARAAMHNGEESAWITISDIMGNYRAMLASDPLGGYPVSGDDMPHRRGDVS